MPKPYTIRLFVPEGDPDLLKIITKMNWTGIGLDVAREAWSQHKNRKELDEAGIYILSGYEEDDDLPTIYIGQGDGVRSRIESHYAKKEFWDRALVFVSSNAGLNRAHITWLEWALIQQAKHANRCRLDNGNFPSEPVLTESEKADTQEFLNEILSILPLVEMRVFEKGKKIEVEASAVPKNNSVMDTVVVPAQEDGFQETFLGENCWYAIRIHAGRIQNIKYIAAYQTAPVSAITHVAEVESIEPYGDGGKYKVNFAGPAIPVGPIAFGDAKQGSMQSPRYTIHTKLMKAKTLTDLF